MQRRAQEDFESKLPLLVLLGDHSGEACTASVSREMSHAKVLSCPQIPFVIRFIFLKDEKNKPRGVAAVFS